MRVNHGLRPPNGPHFPVADGVVLNAHTFDILEAMIVEYRMRHGIDPGDPKKDIDNYVCAKWPNACLTEAGDGPRQEDLKRSMAQRVATWSALKAREMPAGGYDLVDDGVAASRAAACRTCPFNRPWKTNCAPCNATSLALLASIRRLRTVNKDFVLTGCEIAGIDLDTAAFLPEGAMKQKDEIRERMPPGCWIKPIT